MDAIRLMSQDSLKAEKPVFEIGDTVRVHVRIVEGSRSRIQVYEGIVIAMKHLSSVVVATQGLNERVGGGLHVDEIGTERAGAVEHEHNHRALVFVDDLRIARGVKLAVRLPCAGGGSLAPEFYIVSSDLVAVQIDQVLE